MVEIATSTNDGPRKIIKELDEGLNVFRIIPGFGANAKSGKYREYYRVEFGYYNSANQMKPFQGSTDKDFNGNMVVEGAAYKRRMELQKVQAQVLEEIKQLEASGQPVPPALEEKKKMITGLCMKFNDKGVHCINAINLKGEIYCQKLGAKAWGALKEKITEATNLFGINPILIDGCFFSVTKTKAGPNGRDTTYSAAIYMESIVGGAPGAMQAKFHKLTPDIIARLEKEAWDLNNIWITVTPEEEERIVKEGPSGVDAVFKARSSNTTTVPAAPTTPVATAPVSTPVVETPVYTAPVTVITPSVDADALMASLGNTSAPVGEVKTEIATDTGPANKTAMSMSKSDDDFLSGLGV